MLKLLLFLILSAGISCNTAPQGNSPIIPEISSPRTPLPPQSAKPEDPLLAKPEKQSLTKTIICTSLPAGIKLPHYLSSVGVVLIGFQKPCEGVDGKQGYLPGSSWTAMGFPCAGGRGRLEKKGSDNIPSVVSFPLLNSCPMQPSRVEDVEHQVRQKLHLPSDSHLIAYYPLSVDYWEFADFGEHDLGSKPELFAPMSITNGWLKFSTKNEALKVRLYGRENAWERGKYLFEVKGFIQPEGRNGFKLLVTEVRSLDEAARAAVQVNCEALRPRRNCEEVFMP